MDARHRMTYFAAIEDSSPSPLQARPQRPTTLSGLQLWMARALWLLVLLIVLAVLVALVPINYWTTWGEWQVGQARPAVRAVLSFGGFVRLLTWIELAGAVIALLVALVLAWKRSDDRMGLFVSATLLLIAPMQISSNVDLWRLPSWLSPLAPLVQTMPALTMAAIVLLFYVFPDGRFVPGWMRVPALAALAIFAGLWVHAYLQDIGILPVQDFGWMALVVTLTISILVASCAQVYRYRRLADVVQRQQMKWVLLGLGCLPLWVLLGVLGSFINTGPWYALLQLLVNYLAFILIPLTIGLSMLRFRLWEVDLVLNRALVYTGLTLAVLALYGLLVGGMAFLLQTRVNPALAVAATAVVALLALPLRQRLQGIVNRLMYGERDDPVDVLTRLGQSLETAGAPDMVLPGLVAAIAEALRLPYVAIALHQDGQLRLVATYPEAAPGPVSDEVKRLPLTYQGEVIGQLLVAPRAPGEAFSPADERLLQGIARQAGAAAHAVRLTADLQRSRERLVAAREEERRRLRRDLHDGLGPQLATFALKLDATRNLIQHDPTAAGNLLSQLKGDAQAAIADIRRLVYDLRPPALDQLGLVPALREFAAQASSTNGLSVCVEAPAVMPVLPAAVEVAVYRIATEALANVVNHAGATTCRLRLEASDQNLVLEVTDDGRGLSLAYQAGVGLASMRERATELGGACTIEPLSGGGTRVLAVLPLPKATP